MLVDDSYLAYLVSHILESQLISYRIHRQFHSSPPPHITMHSIPLLLTLLATSTPSLAVDSKWGNIGVGAGVGPWPLTSGQEAGEKAGRHPNATSSVTFQRSYNGEPETWGWRINITDLAIPNNPDQFGNASANASEGYHVANTQWELTWPAGSDNFTEFLNERNMTASFAAYLANKPANITNRYNASANGDCTALLGKECVDAIKRSASSSSTTPDILGNAECEDTLDYRYGANYYNGAISWRMSCPVLPSNLLFISKTIIIIIIIIIIIYLHDVFLTQDGKKNRK
jgi:hypothetical protein